MVANQKFVRWDLWLLALLLPCFSAAAWQLWPGAAVLSEPPAGAIIIKAAIASFGLVGFAVQWERLWPLVLKRPECLLVPFVCLVSPVWAVAPALALQSAIMLFLVWVFGWVMMGPDPQDQRPPFQLPQAIALAGALIVLLHVGVSGAYRDPTALKADGQGDVAFALVGAAWALAMSPQRPLIWGIWLACLVVLAGIAGLWLSLLVVLIGVAAGLMSYGLSWLTMRIVWTPILLALCLVPIILGMAALVAFGPSAGLDNVVDGPGVLGYGFGVTGSSFADGFGNGLGLIGVFTVLAWALAASVRLVLAGQGDRSVAVAMRFGVWAAGLASLGLLAPSVAINGPWIALLAGLSFHAGSQATAPKISSASR